MASTGEVACFGKDVREAYWTALQSIQNFKVPKPGNGILFGGDTSKPELGMVAKILSPLGYKFYASNPDVAAHLDKELGSQQVTVIEFPKTNKRKLRAVFQKYNIDAVMNLASARGRDTLDEDYVQRRNCVDFNIPLFNDPKCAVLFCQALEVKLPTLNNKETPAEVRRWSEFVGGKML